MKRWQTLLLGVVISALTLAYALNGNDLSKLGQEFGRGNYLFLIPTLPVVVIGLGLRALRWQALLNDKIKLNRSFNIMNVGYLFSIWLPLRLNEVARSFLVTRLTPPISIFTSLSSIILERLIDLLAVVVLVVIAIATAPVGPELVSATRAAGFTAILGILALASFVWQPRVAHFFVNLLLRILPFLERFNIRHILDRILDGLAPLKRLRLMVRISWWTAAAWAASVVSGFILLYVFYDSPNWMSALLISGIAAIAIALPAVPGSVGPFEAAVILGLQLSGMINASYPPERAFAFAVLLHIVNVGAYTVMGLIGLAQEKITLREVVGAARQVARRNKEQEPDEQKQASEAATAP
jgi:uncharacterized membrane protein YbhN (UPF0104 family)